MTVVTKVEERKGSLKGFITSIETSLNRPVSEGSLKTKEGLD